ncbi:hypothetical protein GF385_01630 [Candidatus Dependentiae bacterium]|nr:hypothetical protein [Candidatus Dependentiae bacterium]
MILKKIIIFIFIFVLFQSKIFAKKYHIIFVLSPGEESEFWEEKQKEFLSLFKKLIKSRNKKVSRKSKLTIELFPKNKAKYGVEYK